MWRKSKLAVNGQAEPYFTKGIPTDSAVIDASGTPIGPESTLAFRASLAGLRGELARAQHADPVLHEIRSMLKNQPAGTYISEPRGPETKKVKERTHKFRLTSDNLLVAKDNGSATEDRPVIPNVPYKGPDAPRTMTWKHLMLGAVHNTTLGQHRSAREMEL